MWYFGSKIFLFLSIIWKFSKVRFKSWADSLNEILDLLDGYYWWFILVSSKKKTSGAEINENEKVVSSGSQLLEQTGIFKEFITIIEKTLALEWKSWKALQE